MAACACVLSTAPDRLARNYVHQMLFGSTEQRYVKFHRVLKQTPAGFQKFYPGRRLEGCSLRVRMK
jgi:hypothetical protein